MEQKLTKKQQKELVEDVWKDFKRRKEERMPFELQWQLNINFLMGNQYCDINSNNILKENEKKYYWEERQVFNHIAPIIETRVARLAEVKPAMVVLPASSSEEDIGNAKVCKDILNSISSKLDLPKLISEATNWSEICGTSFYKIVWNTHKGSIVGLTEVGEKIYEGDVDVLVCSPFEIYPDSNSALNFSECKSIIHARSYDADTVNKLWGLNLEGADIDSYALSNVHNINSVTMNGFSKLSKTLKHNQVMVLERYEMPSKKYENGRLVVVVDNDLAYVGPLPYKNMTNKERGFPFVKQVSINQPAVFWGSSVIDRLIPVQRSFNTVKNRKHEFMNRTIMGVLAVEDGSCDIDALEEDGLAPGTVLVYRQGSELPKMICDGTVPKSFEEEEEKLLNELLSISGVNDVFGGKNAQSLASMSGVALQLLIEQEYSRISASGENIKFAVKEIAEHILRLYKQFVVGNRISRLVKNNGATNFFYWNNGTISSDDIVFDTQSENLQSLAQKRNFVLELLEKGIFNDENGSISNETRLKILDMLGFGMWEESLDGNSLQLQKAKRENTYLLTKNEIPEVLEIHNHQTHIDSHTSFMLSMEFENALKDRPELKEIMLNHIKEHKEMLKSSKKIEKEGK